MRQCSVVENIEVRDEYVECERMLTSLFICCRPVRVEGGLCEDLSTNDSNLIILLQYMALSFSSNSSHDYFPICIWSI